VRCNGKFYKTLDISITFVHNISIILESRLGGDGNDKAKDLP